MNRARRQTALSISPESFFVCRTPGSSQTFCTVRVFAFRSAFGSIRHREGGGSLPSGRSWPARRFPIASQSAILLSRCERGSSAFVPPIARARERPNYSCSLKFLKIFAWRVLLSSVAHEKSSQLVANERGPNVLKNLNFLKDFFS